MGDLVHLRFGPRRGVRRATPALAEYDRGCALQARDPSDRSGLAVKAYQRALASRPDLAVAHNNLGKIMHERGELAAAEAHYRLALCTDRNVALFWFNLGVVLEDLGRHAEAIVSYEHAVAHHQTGHRVALGVIEAHYNLARIYEAIGRNAEDDAAIRSAIRHLVSYRQLAR